MPTQKTEVSLDSTSRRVLERIAKALEDSNRIAKKADTTNEIHVHAPVEDSPRREERMLSELIDEWGALGVIAAVLALHPSLGPNVVFPPPQSDNPEPTSD